MTRLWHRRSSEAILFAMFVVVGLSAWFFFARPTPVTSSFYVSPIIGIFALITISVTLVSYFTTSLRQLAPSALINYALTCGTLAALTLTSGGVTSGYLGLFVACLGFAGFFHTEGAVIGTIAYAVLIVQQFLAGMLTAEQLIILAVLGGTPLIVGVLLWGKSDSSNDNGDTKEDRSYHELASELSQVSGESEVVINAIDDGVIALNGQGIIQLVNPAAERLLGWGRRDSLNLSYKSVFKMLNTKDQLVDQTNDPVTQSLTTNHSSKNDNFSLQTQSGKSFIASISVNPVGQPGQGVIIVFRDITTEKSDERQRAEFISTASHEMRTPVASIEGYLGLTLNPATATIDDKARDFITKAHQSAEHLGRLFADLLDVSKADDSRLKNDPRVVDVVPFVHDIVQGLTPKATEKDLHVLYKPIPDDDEDPHGPVRRLNPVFYANVDNDHLREIIQNLVENAIKYTPKGDVIVDVTGDDSHVVISVADTGIGIPREDQAHLFQKFYRVDNSDTREIGGTGLGLYLCRRLTETIGGRIWVESEYKKGSTFYVEIPRTSHDEAQRLIEQASVTAEQQAEREQEEAAHEATSATTVTSMRTDGIAPQTPLSENQPPLTPQPVATSAPTPSNPIIPIPQAAQQPIEEARPLSPQNQNPTVNIPISSIEANPSQYLTRRGSGIAVPPRRQ